jgi:hypothetical protein
VDDPVLLVTSISYTYLPAGMLPEAFAVKERTMMPDELADVAKLYALMDEYALRICDRTVYVDRSTGDPFALFRLI